MQDAFTDTMVFSSFARHTLIKQFLTMSDNNRSGGNSKGSKRNLPSWMSSRVNEHENCGKKPSLDAESKKLRGELAAW